MLSVLKKRTGKNRYLIIYNRRSGAKKIFEPEKILRHFFTKNKISHHFIYLDKKSSSQISLNFRVLKSKLNFNRILVAGGDGTLRSIVQEFYDQKNYNIPIAFFPTGSTNVFARILGIPLSRSIKNLQYLLSPQKKKLTVFRLNKKHIFLLGACFGKLAEFSIQAEKHYKHILGPSAYLLTALKYALTFPKKTISLTRSGKSTKKMQVHSVMIFPGIVIKKFLPFLKSPVDKLQVVLLKNKNLLELTKLVSEAFLLKRKPKNVDIFSSKKITLEGNFAEQVHLDGDAIESNTKKYLIEALNKKITFLC